MFDFAKQKNPLRGNVTLRGMERYFSDCADLEIRELRPGGGPVRLHAVWLDGLTDADRLARDVLGPLGELRCRTAEDCLRRAARGGVSSGVLRERRSAAQAQEDVAAGCVAVILDDLGTALTFELRSGAVRSVEAPSVEKSVMGARDAFVETLRMNTALVRRRLPGGALKLRQIPVGTLAPTAVDILYVEGAAPGAHVEAVEARLRAVQAPSVTDPGTLERALAGRPRGAFPQVLHTERPDKFARELLRGKVGVLSDGLPVGFLLPGTIPEMLSTQEDQGRHAAVARALTLLRWAALLIALLLPAVYVAAAMYHQEMIPGKLLRSVIRSKAEVPFSTAAEVLGMLLSFELVQEAGIRLPDPVGQTVSVIGALIVGQSAVEAKVLSPIVIIVVAMAGISCYILPSQELGAAVRLWRFALVGCAAALGLFGVMAGLTALLWRLCDAESLGTSLLWPLCDAPRGRALRTLLRPPPGKEKGGDKS